MKSTEKSRIVLTSSSTSLEKMKIETPFYKEKKMKKRRKKKRRKWVKNG